MQDIVLLKSFTLFIKKFIYDARAEFKNENKSLLDVTVK